MNRSALLFLAAVAVPAVATAQQTGQDSSHTGRGGRMPHDSALVRRSSNGSYRGSGRRSSGSANMGLSSDQVSQLQQALTDAGCDAGTVDGKIGPRTRSALSCARRKNNLTGNNTNELLRSLNLSFTVDDSTGMGSINRRGSRQGGERDAASDSSGAGTNGAANAVRGDRSQTGGGNRGRIRPPADSGRAGGANPQSPQQAQHGGGMHDSTTSTSKPPR